MTVAEATRQFQDSLEARRRTRTRFADTLSAETELANAEDEVQRAYQQLQRIYDDAQNIKPSAQDVDSLLEWLRSDSLDWDAFERNDAWND